MLLGGMTNPITQYALLRLDHVTGERQPQAIDVGQIVMSRVVSAMGAGTAVALAELHATTALRSAERVMDGAINRLRGVHSAVPRPMIDAETAFSETLAHNMVQSVGGITSATVFQSLYDHVIGRTAPQSAQR